MTLLDLTAHQRATIIHVPVEEHERLHARGIGIGDIVTRPYTTHTHQPVLVRTTAHNMFAMSRSLAEKILIALKPL